MRLLISMTSRDGAKWGRVWHLAPSCESLLLELMHLDSEGRQVHSAEACSVRGVALGPVLMATQDRLAKHCGLAADDPPGDDPSLWRFRIALPSKVMIEFVDQDERDDVDRMVWEISSPVMHLPELATALDRARAAARGHR